MKAFTEESKPRWWRIRFLQVMLPVVLLLIWHFAALRSPLVPAPLATLDAGWQPVASGEIWVSLINTIWPVIAGFAAAATIGTPLGMLLGRFETARRIAAPIITALFSIPRIVVYPVLMIAFGAGLSSKIWLAGIGAVFPILLTTIAASRLVPERLIRMARAFGCSPARIFWSVFLPACRPALVAALRIGVSVAFVTVVIAEMFATDEGLGVVVQKAYALRQYDLMFGTVAQLTFIALIIHIAFGMFERRRQ
ncbi:ABC-type nitrate/sulfonate/bicarbonate transport system permease component [Paraburkholderia sp. HC6.4b]|uniref:ABC transporter permease n=1 Tax=unclassified Paraburkholderia TaxID=2615204 RepID=UPI00160AA879|nr:MULTISPECIES: ABC transporter permease [unclassified Paraburkholderia]MBB5406323.1 ABC-type nitrate/sulfonate/bicarbonate transport system permease component [Paraburkholderia sp. HC6.4b]MBB5448721.1 ABC-type nitrate/sulfonate/bicarbonate transport system permease component [Paraburkholderia sp. Kb1A]